MVGGLDIKQEKSRVTAFVNAGAVLFITYLIFWGLSGICFGIVELAERLALPEYEDVFSCDWAKFFYHPGYVFELYGEWWERLIRSIRLMDVRLVLLAPFIVPAAIVATVVLALAGRNYSFHLWYVLNHHFAKAKDIEHMGLGKELFMVLGRFGHLILSVRPTESVLCIGEMGTGKTSSVAIPSVLRSDNASIVAVDMTGLLPKYTAGYRATLGEVFYYNWDLLDDPDKGVFYPRWNPLARVNMPKKQEEKDAYLRRIAGYLADTDDTEKDNYWNLLARSVIAALLGYWCAKENQAKANDYFLGKLVEGKHLSREEKDILLSYYIQMPPAYAEEARRLLEEDELNQENYLPIGSWAGVAEQWIGREVCFAGITDWLIEHYMTAHDNGRKDWREWVESLLAEAYLFGYGSQVIDGLKQFMALSSRQRQIAFACVIKPFRIFVNQAIRERTNGNDFNMDKIRGVYDEKQKCWRPVTVYSMANTYASKILNQMFLDEIMYRNLYLQGGQGPLPLMLVLDDVGHNLRLKYLTSLLTEGKTKKMSALLLCNSLSLVENTYSREELETIVMNTAYKIIKAPDNQKLSRQLDKLATFASKSVQISKNGEKKRKGKYFANTYYFHRLAQDFSVNRRIKIDTKDHQVVLAEGYYNRPILADNIFFAEDDRFRKLAVLDAEYSLSREKIEHKTKFELETPKLSEVFAQKDLGVEDLVELDQYMNVVFEEVKLEIGTHRKSPKTVAREAASAAHVEKEKQKRIDTEGDWWLREDAFSAKSSVDRNPFNPKK